MNNTKTLKDIAEKAWARQADHQRFRPITVRPDDHPSKVPWLRANKLWAEQARARKKSLAASSRG